MTPTTYMEVPIMMKRYKIGNNFYWYKEGTQPDCAVEAKQINKVETSEDAAEVKTKVKTAANKSKGVKAK